MAAIVMVKRREYGIGVFARIMRINWLYIVETIFYQMSISPRRGVNRIVWMSLAIGLFVLIHGYVCNLIKVEKVAIMPKPEIEKIDNLLYDEEFAHHQISISKSLYFYGHLRLSKERKLRHLYERMLLNNDCSTIDRCSFIEFRRDPEFFKAVLNKVRSAILKADGALLLNSYFMRGGADTLCCTLFPELWSKVEESKQPFARDLLVWYYNRKLPMATKRYIDYQTRTKFEFGLSALRAKQLTSIMVNSVTNGLRSTDEWSVTSCLDNVKDDQNSLPAPMDIHAIRSTLIALSWLVVVICSCLVLEVIHERFRQVRSEKQRVQKWF